MGASMKSTVVYITTSSVYWVLKENFNILKHCYT